MHLSQRQSDNSDQSRDTPLRIVLAKVGLDGHDRGIKVVARGLRYAGFHVIYGGWWQTPEVIAQTVGDPAELGDEIRYLRRIIAEA